MIGYGVIRCFVEGLRTDSLYLMPGVRVSQVLSGCLILLGVLLVGIIRRKYGINILGIKHSGKIVASITPDTVLSGEITILALGEYKALQKCFRI